MLAYESKQNKVKYGWISWEYWHIEICFDIFLDCLFVGNIPVTSSGIFSRLLWWFWVDFTCWWQCVCIIAHFKTRQTGTSSFRNLYRNTSIMLSKDTWSSLIASAETSIEQLCLFGSGVTRVNGQPGQLTNSINVT